MHFGAFVTIGAGRLCQESWQGAHGDASLNGRGLKPVSGHRTTGALNRAQTSHTVGDGCHGSNLSWTDETLVGLVGPLQGTTSAGSCHESRENDVRRHVWECNMAKDAIHDPQ